MLCRYGADRRQAETHAASALLGAWNPVKGLEDPLHLLGRHACTAIPDAEFHLAAVHPRGTYLDRCPGAIAAGILKQVANHPLEQGAVPDDLAFVTGKRRAVARAFLAGPQLRAQRVLQSGGTSSAWCILVGSRLFFRRDGLAILRCKALDQAFDPVVADLLRECVAVGRYQADARDADVVDLPIRAGLLHVVLDRERLGCRLIDLRAHRHLAIARVGPQRPECDGLIAVGRERS